MIKKAKTAYYIVTGLLTLMMLFSIFTGFFMHDTVVEVYEELNYPSFLVYPVSVAKLLGLIAIWYNKNKTLKEWAYAGFCFDFLLAFLGHIMASDGKFFMPLIALALLFGSSFLWRRIGLMLN